MGMTITFVGGPADGRQMAIPNDEPPWTYFVPIERPFVAGLLTLGILDYTPPQAAEYEPLTENGWLSRADDGSVRYRYRGTPEPLHCGQKRPTPTLDELAGMFNDPPPSAYPSSRAHLLACRTRHSLWRDARLNREEEAVVMAGFLADVRAELAKRRHEDT